MASKQYNTLIPMIALGVLVGLCEGVDLSSFLQGGGLSGAALMPSCLQKLVPCESFLKYSPVDSPPASCCTPLTEMISDNPECICQVFDNSDLLKNLNVTQDQLLKLPKACGSDADISVCKNDAESPNGSTPTTPSDSGSSSSKPDSTSTPKSGSNVISHLGGSGLAACFIMGLIISAS